MPKTFYEQTIMPMSEEKNPRQYFYQLKENEESQVVHHNSCLIANPFACEQDSQTTELPIIHPAYTVGFLKKTR